MRILFSYVWLMATVAICCPAAPIPNLRWQKAVDSAAHSGPEMRVVILDRVSGTLIASHQLNAASRTLAAPGSVLKPLLLYQSIETGQWEPSRRISCNRQLVIGKHRLACSHPEAPPFNAREALAWSCNSYFAAMAQALRPGQMKSLLEPTRLLDPTGLVVGEAVAGFRDAGSRHDHRMPGRSLAELTVKEQVAGKRKPYIAADEIGVALDQCSRICEFGKCAVG